jgi:hypothetical protein
MKCDTVRRPESALWWLILTVRPAAELVHPVAGGQSVRAALK